jgi:hypothetical protein
MSVIEVENLVKRYGDEVVASPSMVPIDCALLPAIGTPA